MTTPPDGPDGSSGDLPDWAVPTPMARRPERSGGYVQLVLGLLLVVVSVVLVGVEAWQILTQPKVAYEPTVVERLGWPLIPAVFGVGLLVERWLDQRSIDVR